MSYNRFLFVGLGGSGGSTLGHLKNNIKQWLEENGQPADIPEGWQFLHIDTPSKSDIPPDLKLLDHEYLGLIPHSGMPYSDVGSSLINQVALHKDLETWCVAPINYPYALGTGAGQYRAIGTTVAMNYAGKIKAALVAAYSRLNSNGAKASLSTLYTAVTGISSNNASPLRVVLVSSLAGGSGAGMLMTVADIMRALGEEGSNEIFGILYTPDAFGQDSSFSGTTPNSLAAISEILNGHWWGGSGVETESSPQGPHPQAKQLELLKMHSLPKALETSGPRFPFLVGRTNTSGVDHESASNLFSVVGGSLLSWTTDTTIQSKFIAFTIGNWRTASTGHNQGVKTLLNEGNTSEKGYPGISSLGFARLSLGSDYFEEYAAKRIARDVHEFILFNHVGGDAAKTKKAALGTVDPDKIASAVAADHLAGWLDRCNLDELGPERNQIQDALVPDDVIAIDQSFKAQSETLSGIGGNESLKSDQWLARLEEALFTSQITYGEAYLHSLDQKVLEWIKNIQESICRETSRAISILGLKITAALLAQTAVKMEDVSDELRSVDAVNFTRWAKTWKDTFRGALDNASGKIPATNAQLGEAFDQALYYCKFSGAKMGAERSAELVDELVDRLLRPMQKAVDEAYEATHATWLTEATDWPAWAAVAIADELTPPDIESVLIDSDSWHELFEKLLQESFPEELPDDLRVEARRTVSEGSFNPEPKGHDQCIELTGNWMPMLPVFVGSSQSPTNLQLSINLSKGPVVARAKQWLRRSASPFGEFLNAGLRSYLDNDGLFDGNTSKAEYKRRQTKFMALLAATMDAAEPLVDIDTTLMGLVHPSSNAATARYFSAIPLGAHKISQEVESLLGDPKPEDAPNKYVMSSEEKIIRIDITTTLGAPHNLLVIESLLGPISEGWAGDVMNNTTDEFWDMRRTKPLREFIPAPQALIHCMIRGWYTARLLGKVDMNKQPIEIVCPGRHPAQFPKNLLSPNPSGSRDTLASVLESLSIAMVKCSEIGELEPLEAYTQLRDLGTGTFTSEKNSGLYMYEGLNQELIRWIQTGEIETSDGWTVNPRLKTEAPGSSKEAQLERVTKLVAELDESNKKTQEKYEEILAGTNINPTTLPRTPLWRGLADQIMSELNKLHKAAETYADTLLESIKSSDDEVEL